MKVIEVPMSGAIARRVKRNVKSELGLKRRLGFFERLFGSRGKRRSKKAR